jgi:hypothetical protein
VQRNTKERRKERCTRSLAVALLGLARVFSRRNKRRRPKVKQPRPKQAAGAVATKGKQAATARESVRQAREFRELDNHLVFHHFLSTTTPNPLYDCALTWLFSSPTPSPPLLHFRRALCPDESLFSTRAAPPCPASINPTTLCLSQQTHARVETQALLPPGSAPYFTPAATTTHLRRTLPPPWLRQYRSWMPLSRPFTAVTESRYAMHTTCQRRSQANHLSNSKNKPKPL